MALLLEEALDMLLKETLLCEPITVPIEEGYNLILAEDIYADVDFPPFDRSPLDGYAVKMEDVAQATLQQPVQLEQIENVPAGSWPIKKIVAGTAARIMTGAKIPEGADAVIRLEDTSVDKNTVRIYNPVNADKQICRQGEEIRRGTRVLNKGTQLQAGALGVLAMLGKAHLLVYRQPKVAILATGSEIVGVQESLTQGKIRNSNSYMLLAKVKEAGCIPLLLGQVEDDLEEIHKQIMQSAPFDVLITTGGASIGDYDLMAAVFKKMDVPLLFSRLAIKPGMPVLAGFWNTSLLVALSGNPAAASVSFDVLLRPVLRKMAGFTEWELPVIQAKLKTAFSKPIQSRRFIFAKCEPVAGVMYVEPVQFHGNGMLSGLALANALIDVPAYCESLKAGTDVRVLLLK